MSKLFMCVAVLGMLLCSIVSGAAAQTTAPAAAPTVPAQYAATAIGQGGVAAGKTFGLKIYIDAVTPDGQFQELVGTLKAKGQSGLVDKMQDMKDIGRISPDASVGTGVRVIQISAGKNGGEHIVMATDRNITFAELYNGTRSRDYPLAFLVLDVDKDGKGTGIFAPLCKAKFNKKGQLEIEHYGQKPFRLSN